MKKNIISVAYLVLISGFLFLSQTSFSADAVRESFFTPELERLQETIARVLIKKIETFVEHLNKTGSGKLEVIGAFYDAPYHRLYIDFSGEMKVANSVAMLLGKRDNHVSGEGYIPFDLNMTDFHRIDNGMKCTVEGDLIFFIDQILIQFAQSTPGLNMAYTPAGQTLLKFIDSLDVRPIAEALGKALTEFSPDNLQKLTTEIQKRIDSAGNTPLEKVLNIARGTGEFTAFFVLTLIKSFPSTIAVNAGVSLGGAIGTFLVPIPGVGTVVGGFIGSYIVGQATAKIHRLPTEHQILKMKKFGKMIQSSERPNALLTKLFEKARKQFREHFTKSLDNNSYTMIDVFLNEYKKASVEEKKSLSAAATDVKAVLEFQLNQKNDRFAGRKLKQLNALLADSKI
ncbi:MAG: hypothetical protein HQM10_09845 [Candidatus Riflebacteria bacterium]|nr:hypothetical protein [Candidatus Riflebacteria bacterium]